MQDTYNQDKERIQCLLSQIKTDLNDRKQKRIEGKSTSIMDAEIRGSISSLNRELDIISQLIDSYTSQNKFNILAREIEKRRNTLIQFINQKNEIKQKFQELFLSEQKNTLFSQSNKDKNKPLSETDNKTAFQSHKQNYQKQNDQLESINQKLTGIKYVGIGINDSIKQQNKLMHGLTSDIDKAQDVITRSKKKMNKFVESTSNCALMTTIALELILLIFICV